MAAAPTAAAGGSDAWAMVELDGGGVVGMAAVVLDDNRALGVGFSGVLPFCAPSLVTFDAMFDG